MLRTMLTDEHWLKLVIILRQIGIYNKPNLRLTIEGMLYHICIACPFLYAIDLRPSPQHQQRLLM